MMHAKKPNASRRQDRVSEPLRVMVVDDDGDVIEQFAVILDFLGLRLQAFLDPEEALRTFRAEPDAYDLLFVNVLMPNMLGNEFVEHARACSPSVPIVVETAMAWDVVSARFPPDVAHLAKPFTIADVEAAILAVVRPTD